MKTVLSLLILFITMATRLYAQDAVIVGTNTFVQGTYNYVSDINGKPMYQGPIIFGAYQTSISWDAEGEYWLLSAEYFSNKVYEYTALVDSPLPPDKGWVRGGGEGSAGGNPIPTFSGGVTAIVDNDGPAIITKTPADDALDVASDNQIAITFDEPVKAGSGNVTIYKADGTLYFEADVTNSFEVTIEGKTLTLTSPNLSSEQQFYILIDAGALLDIFDNSFAGISDNTDWDFESDFVGVTVSGAGSDDFNGVYEGTAVTNSKLSYSKGDYRIRLSSSPSGWVIENTIDDSKGAYISGAVSFLSSSKPTDVGYEPTDKINDIPAQFPAPTLSGNVEAASLALRATYPEDGIDDFPLVNNLEMRFTHAIQFGSGNIVLYDGANNVVETYDVSSSDRLTIDGNSLTIDPTDVFTNETSYYILVDNGAIQDLSGNPWAGISSRFNSFFFEVNESDIVVENAGWQPFNMALNQYSTLNNKPAYSTSDYSITLYWYDDVAPAKWILKKGNLSYVNYSDTPLPPDTGWEAQAVSELTIPTFTAPNPAPSISGTTSTYVAPDITPPTITSFSPTKSATFVQPLQSINISFDENVSLGQGNISIYQADGTLFETINISSSETDVEGDQVTISRENYFGSSENYYILIDAGVFLDYKGNAFEGISSNTVWTFTSKPLLEVTNAGTTQVNAFYDLVEYESGRPLFTRLGGFNFSSSIQWWPNSGNLGGEWRIQYNGNYYYESEKDTLAPSTHTWAPSSYGEEPTPGNTPNPILIYGTGFEFVRPTVTLSSTTPTNTNQSSIDVDIVFSELVQDFNSTNIYLTNATLSSLTGAGTNFTASISLEDEGEVKLRVSGNKDLIGNPQEANAEITFQYDQTAPTVILSTSLGATTSLTAFDLFLEFNEAVQNYDPSLLTITNAKVLNTTVQTDTKIKVRLEKMAKGTITAQLEAGAVSNLVGLENEASTVFSIIYDPLAPSYFLFDTLNTEYGSDFLVTDDKSIIVVGNSYPETSNDFTTVKFNEDTSRPWVNIEGGSGTDEAFQVLTDGNFLYVLGAITNETSRQSEGAIYKYDFDGNEVAKLITDKVSSFGDAILIDGYIYDSGLKNDAGQRRAISKISTTDFSIEIGEEALYTANDIFAGGFLHDETNDFIYFSALDRSVSPAMFVVGKYDLNLNKQWVKSFAPANGTGNTKDIALDENQDLIFFANDDSQPQNLYFIKLAKLDGSTSWQTAVALPNGGYASGGGILLLEGEKINYVTTLDNTNGDSDIAVGRLTSAGLSEYVALTDIGSQQAYNSLYDAKINQFGELLIVSGYYDGTKNVVSLDKFDLSDGGLKLNLETYSGAFNVGVSAKKMILQDEYLYVLMQSNKGQNYARVMDVVRFVDEAVYNSFNPVLTWTGTEDTDWGKSGNWSSGSIPTATDDVVVSATQNQPIISGDYAVDDISINSGAIVTIASNGSLAISGNASGDGASRVATTVEGDGAYSMLGSTLDPVIYSEGATIPDFIYGFENNNYVIPTALEAGKGYFVSYAGSAQSLELDGKLVSGSVAVDFTFSDDAIDNDYELLANPYNAAISHSKLVAANGVTGSGIVDGVIYLWRDGGANLANGIRDGAYETVLADGTTTGSFAGQLSRGEGFFLKSIASGSFQFTSDMQRSASQARLTANSVNDDLKLTLSNETSSDVLIIKYLENATSGKDLGLDASKFINPSLSFYTMLENERMAIQSLPLNEGASTNLGIKALRAGKFTMVVEHLPTHASITLIDKKTNQSYLLKANTTINLTLDKATQEDRFVLVYEPNKVLANELLSSEIQVFGTPKALQIQYAGENEKVQIISISGKVIYENTVAFDKNRATINTKLKTNQVYILKINDFSVKFLLK